VRVFNSTGATGITGATGAGVQGATGASGVSGYMGATGATGASGLQGATGSGATGASGATGTIGATGASGIAGLNGATGLQGATGTIGATGASGVTGFTGATGATGLGFSGITSTTSVTPASTGNIVLGTNAQGAFVTGDRVRAVNTTANYFEGVVTITSGTTFTIAADLNVGTTAAASWTLTLAGNRGATGAGATGASGVTGFTGATGASGVTGFTGATGASGVTGFVGATGASGASFFGITSTTTVTPASTGNIVLTTNAQGAFVTGDRVRVINTTSNYFEGTLTVTGGTSFSVAADFNVGTTAASSWTMSLAGARGSTGPIGATGASGFAGTTGATGASGLRGTTGPNGATGASGVTGFTGATGASGVTGFVGATGASGVTGFVGATGASGLGFIVTSTSTATPASSGTITLVTNTQGAYVTGTRVRAVNTTSNYFEGIVTVTGTSFAIAADLNVGTTAASSWTITNAGARGSTGVGATGASGVVPGQEPFTALASSTGVVVHNYALGQVFYHTSIAANFTCNVTNLDTTSLRATVISLILVQGATPFIANAFQIAGAAQTIRWLGGVAPTGTANRVESIAFSVINNAGTYTVLGQLNSYA